jgi:hypothetical protein
MSRGHGKVQRAILAAVQDDWLTVEELTTVVYNSPSPTAAQSAAVRRAVRSLLAGGLVTRYREAVSRPPSTTTEEPFADLYECTCNRSSYGTCVWCERGVEYENLSISTWEGMNPRFATVRRYHRTGGWVWKREHAPAPGWRWVIHRAETKDEALQSAIRRAELVEAIRGPCVLEPDFEQEEVLF